MGQKVCRRQTVYGKKSQHTGSKRLRDETYNEKNVKGTKSLMWQNASGDKTSIGTKHIMGQAIKRDKPSTLAFGVF